MEGIPAILKYESAGSVYGLTRGGLDQVYIWGSAKYENMTSAVVADCGKPEGPN